MDVQRLIEMLSTPGVYQHHVDHVDVRHTHLSAVFLAGPYDYKIKKPVQLSFVDFSTLSLREHFCREEVRLNRRLAPDVYLDVVPIALAGNQIKVEGPGSVIEWAVKMRRLPEEATLKHRLLYGEVDVRIMQALAERVAHFHASAVGGQAIAEFGRFDVVAGNARENFDQLVSQIGVAISQPVFDRLQALTEARLNQLRPLIEKRAALGIPRDTHGDLRLEHIYLFQDQKPPDDLAIIDCIEFNERFRYADPVSDMAFLVMDLRARGFRDLADAFADAYFRAGGDVEGQSLLPFYVAYRSAVRAKVAALKASEPEVPVTERTEALARSRAHILQALGELEEPGRRPCVILIAGLPGTGKSTLARGLAEQAHARVIRSDVVRKELAAAAGVSPGPASSAAGAIYTDEWNKQTYAECLRQVEQIHFEGGRVIVDANFREKSRRQAFLAVAALWCVPTALLVCRATPETARARLAVRRNDVSDADWDVYERLAERWQEPNDEERGVLHEITTDGTQEDALRQAMDALRATNVQ